MVTMRTRTDRAKTNTGDAVGGGNWGFRVSFWSGGHWRLFKEICRSGAFNLAFTFVGRYCLEKQPISVRRGFEPGSIRAESLAAL